MKTQYLPIYLILASMAVAAVSIGAEPMRQNKKLELSKSEAAKSGLPVASRAGEDPGRGHRIIVIDAPGFDSAVSANVALAIAAARARKRTG